MNAGGEKDGGDAGAVDAGRCHGEGRARDSASAVLVQPHAQRKTVLRSSFRVTSSVNWCTICKSRVTSSVNCLILDLHGVQYVDLG